MTADSKASKGWEPGDLVKRRSEGLLRTVKKTSLADMRETGVAKQRWGNVAFSSCGAFAQMGGRVEG